IPFDRIVSVLSSTRRAVYVTPGAPGTACTVQAGLGPTQNEDTGVEAGSWSTRNSASATPASACASAPLKSWPWRVLFRPDTVRATTAMLRNVRIMITPMITMTLPASSRVVRLVSCISEGSPGFRGLSDLVAAPDVAGQAVAHFHILCLRERDRS